MGKKSKKQNMEAASPMRTRSKKGKGKGKAHKQASPSTSSAKERSPASPELQIHPDHTSEFSSGDEGELLQHLAKLKAKKEKLEGKSRRYKIKQDIAGIQEEIAELEEKAHTATRSKAKTDRRRRRRRDSRDSTRRDRRSLGHDYEAALRLQEDLEDGRRSTAWPSDSDVEEWSGAQAADVHGKGHYQKIHKSGLTVKAADVVVRPQTWPHTSLQDEYASQGIEFGDLDFRLFVAGELETISSQGINHVEKEGRTRLLKQLVYLKGSYDWDTVRSVYVTIVRKIELARAQWSDCFTNDIQWMVTKHMGQSKPAPKWRSKNTAAPAERIHQQEPTWYCAEFQQGKCRHTDHHLGVFRGQTVQLHHICARCWRRQRVKAAHAEAVCKTD